MPSKKKETKSLEKSKIQIDQFCNVVADGYHNAFGDICQWKKNYYLAYRQADWHDPNPPGNIIILSSPEGDIFNWKQVATIDTGGDDRDPHFIKFRDTLQVYWGTYYERWHGKTLHNSHNDLITCGSQTRNGTVWSTPYQIYRPNYWLWGTVQDKYAGTYGMAYHFGPDLCHSLQLLYKPSRKYAEWQTVSSAFNSPNRYRDLSEPTLFSDAPDQIVCLARTTDCLLFGRSHFPYMSWYWTELEIILHSPAVVQYKDRWFVAGRTRLDCIPSLTDSQEKMAAKMIKGLRESEQIKDKKKKRSKQLENYEDWKEMLSEDIYRTVVCELFPDTEKISDPMIVLPSGWDNGYPGIFYDKNIDKLVVQYYTQHLYIDVPGGLPRPADINVVTLDIHG